MYTGGRWVIPIRDNGLRTFFPPQETNKRWDKYKNSGSLINLKNYWFCIGGGIDCLSSILARIWQSSFYSIITAAHFHHPVRKHWRLQGSSGSISGVRAPLVARLLTANSLTCIISDVLLFCLPIILWGALQLLKLKTLKWQRSRKNIKTRWQGQALIVGLLWD